MSRAWTLRSRRCTSGRWAVQGAGKANGGAAVVGYDYDDLHSWSYRGIVVDSDHAVAAAHAPAVVWECPQLVRVDGIWVLIVSPVLSHSPQASGRVAWLAGDLRADSGTLTFEPATGGLLDVGPAFYAPQALVVVDRVLLWGWCLEDGRTPEEADAAGWAGVLSFPRVLAMVDGALVSSPVPELDGPPPGEALPGTSAAQPDGHRGAGVRGSAGGS